MTATLRVAVAVDPEIPVPPTHYGGIERVVDMLVHGLRDRGHDVTLLAHPASTAPADLRPWPGRSSLSRADTLRNMAHLAQVCRQRRVQVVHSFSRLAYLLPLLPLRLPKIMSYQRVLTPSTVARGQRLARPGSLHFTACSRRQAGAYADRPEWHVVPNGVPASRYTFRPAVAPDAPLAFLGRIEAIKGPHVAIEVARRTGRRLVLAGNVPDAPEHRRYFAEAIEPRVDGDRVRYVGPVDDAGKDRLLGSAAALLMPVQWEEPFGIVMAEALACGTPVLGFPRGAVPEVVEDGVTGFLAADAEGLASAVKGLEAIDRAACRRRMEERFSDRAVVGAYEALYRRLAAS